MVLECYWFLSDVLIFNNLTELSFLVLFTYFISLWSDSILCITSIFYIYCDFLRPHIWSLLKNVRYALEKNVNAAVIGWSILLLSVRPGWLIVFFKSSLSFFILCLAVVSIIEIEVLNPPTNIATLSLLQFFQVLFHIFYC